MLQSFIVYGFLGFSLWLLGNIAAKREIINKSHGNATPFWTWEILLALLLFATISGIRWKVGADHLSYLDGYENIKRGGIFRASGVEAGFEYITKIFASLNIHFVFYFAFWAFLQIFFMYQTLRHERYLLPFLGIVIVLGPEYLNWMNGIRQMLSATIFVFAIQFIHKRNLLLYTISILLASTFHKSALFLLTFYYIPQLDYFKNRFINLGILIGTLVIGFNPNFIKSLDFIANILKVIGYDWYSEQLPEMVDFRQEMSVGPRRIVILMVNALTIWYAPKLKKVYSHTNYLIYFNFAFMGILLHNLFANTSHIFLRPVSYFIIFLPLTTAYLLYYLKPQKKYHTSISFLIVFILSISYTFLAVIADYGKGVMDSSNFKFFWDYVH